MGVSVFIGTTSELKNTYVKKCLDNKMDVGIIVLVDVNSGVSDTLVLPVSVKEDEVEAAKNIQMQ